MFSQLVILNHSDDNAGIESIKSKNRNYMKYPYDFETSDIHYSIGTGLDVEDFVEVLDFPVSLAMI